MAALHGKGYKRRGSEINSLPRIKNSNRLLCLVQLCSEGLKKPVLYPVGLR